MVGFATVTHEEAIDAFGQGDLARARDAARLLLGARAFSGVMADARIKVGLERLLQAAGDEAQAGQRLGAVALYSRIGSALRKRPDDPFSLALGRRLARPLPPLHALSDPDDRVYAITAIANAAAEWTPSYLATASVEDGAPRPAEEAVRGLLAQSSSFTEAVGRLRSALHSWTPTTEEPAQTFALRLRRLFENIALHIEETSARGPAASVDHLFPDDSGEGFAHLLRRPEGLRRAEINPRLQGGVFGAALRVPERLIAARFSLATDERTYQVLSELQTWVPPRLWQRALMRSLAATRLRGSVAEAIAMLSRQGRRDDGLASRLVQLSSEKEALRIRTDIADRYPEIPVPVRDWLAGRGPAIFSEADWQSADANRVSTQRGDVARLLRDAFEVAGTCTTLRETLRDNVTLDLLEAQATGLLQHLRLLASKWDLRLRGEVGAVVEFATSEHELRRGPPGVRWVRIIEPGVEFRPPGRSPQLLVKASVEPSRPPGS